MAASARGLLSRDDIVNAAVTVPNVAHKAFRRVNELPRGSVPIRQFVYPFLFLGRRMDVFRGCAKKAIIAITSHLTAFATRTKFETQYYLPNCCSEAVQHGR